jgi:hypothetical protein
MKLFRHGSAADDGTSLENRDLVTCARQVESADKRVVSAADNGDPVGSSRHSSLNMKN